MLVRHGTTDWSEQGRHTGWMDVALNAEGLEQARSLQPALAPWTFNAVLCSPLQRAVETCKLAGCGTNPTIDPDLREWNYGDVEGLTFAQARERWPGWSLWTAPELGGESIEQVSARADRVLSRLNQIEGDVAIFAHGHILRILSARWLAQPPLLGQGLQLSTATISVLSWEHDWRTISRWNDGHHLSATADLSARR